MKKIKTGTSNTTYNYSYYKNRFRKKIITEKWIKNYLKKRIYIHLNNRSKNNNNHNCRTNFQITHINDDFNDNNIIKIATIIKITRIINTNMKLTRM